MLVRTRTALTSTLILPGQEVGTRLVCLRSNAVDQHSITFIRKKKTIVEKQPNPNVKSSKVLADDRIRKNKSNARSAGMCAMGVKTGHVK
uniref:Secreted protein n=1 Tax=Angiostrongylus cantonensis TaxID=6313 RepID=A0A0K0DK54_ANGCA